jgi:multimeric flavodoxin WrbA
MEKFVMGKKVLVLSASTRKGGNSDILSGKFIKGVEQDGKNICQRHGHTLLPCL